MSKVRLEDIDIVKLKKTLAKHISATQSKRARTDSLMSLILMAYLATQKGTLASEKDSLEAD